MIKLVAFDWNGTLLADTLPSISADNQTFKELGINKIITLKEFQATYDIPIGKYFENLGFNRKFFKSNANIIQKAFYKYYEPLENKCRSRSGTREALEWFSKNNIQVLVYSNHYSFHIKKQLLRLKLEEMIHKVIGRPLHSNFHLHNRGKIDWLRKYIISVKLKPQEVVSVGDTCEEIEIGKELGTHTVALTGGYNSIKRLKACKPDFLIHNLKDLIPIIKKLNKQ